MEAAQRRLAWSTGQSWEAMSFAFLASVFVSLAQWQFKAASSALSPDNPLGALASPALWLGTLSYIISLYWTLKAYRWGDISFVLPIVSLCNVWNILLGYFVLGEPLTAASLVGTALIVVGIAVLTR